MTLNAVSLAEPAPAKINLALHVAGQRSDGYHLIESLVVFTEYGDRITVSPAAEDGFVVHGPFAPQLPLDGSNLVLRARDALRAAFPTHPTPPVQIALEKNLPIASGVGGGSSDAGAALRALIRLWRIPADQPTLSRLALPLGADLPMCLTATPLVARGVGEQLELVERFPSLPMVLVNPGVPVATPRVFGALASRNNAPLPELNRSEAGAVIDWLGSTRNDLEPAAISIAPVIADTLWAIRESGALFARMSGSGATCFGIFEDCDRARQAATAIGKDHPEWFSVATTSIAREA